MGSNDSPEIPDRVETSETPCLPSGCVCSYMFPSVCCKLKKLWFNLYRFGQKLECPHDVLLPCCVADTTLCLL